MFRCQDQVCERSEGEIDAQEIVLGNNVWSGIYNNYVNPKEIVA